MARDLDHEDELELEEQRRELYQRYYRDGSAGMSELDLRSAAQHAQAVGDSASERELNGLIEVRERRGY